MTVSVDTSAIASPIIAPNMTDLELTDLEALDVRIRTCEDCGLCQTRTHAVPGEGPPDAEIMFVGEGPGFHEDQQGRPFVGAAGQVSG